jgi:hypothetical protein
LSIDVCPFFFAHCDVCPSILIGETWLKDVLTSPGRQHNNADALSRTPCKVCLRHQERNTEEKSEPECATTLEQVRVTTGSKQARWRGSITPKSSILSIFSFSVCLLPYGKRLSDCLIGTALPVLILCCTKFVILIKLKLFKTGPDQKHLLQEICEKTLQS